MTSHNPDTSASPAMPTGDLAPHWEMPTPPTMVRTLVDPVSQNALAIPGVATPEGPPTPAPGQSWGALPLMPLAIGSAVVMALGSIGPWMTGFGQSVNGSSGDGLITLALAAIGLVLAIVMTTRPLKGRSAMAMVTAIAVTGLFALLAGAADWSGALDFVHDNGIDAQVGWGLPVLVLGSLGMTAAGSLAMRAVYVTRHEATDPSAMDTVQHLTTGQVFPRVQMLAHDQSLPANQPTLGDHGSVPTQAPSPHQSPSSWEFPASHA